MDIKNNEVGVNNFEIRILPKMLAEAGLKVEDLNSLDGGIRTAFVSGAEKLSQIDERGKSIKPVNIGWLSGATHTFFETASGPDEKLRTEKARQTYERAEGYIREVGRDFPVDPTEELKAILFELQDKEFPLLVRRK